MTSFNCTHTSLYHREKKFASRMVIIHDIGVMFPILDEVERMFIT